VPVSLVTDVILSRLRRLPNPQPERFFWSFVTFIHGLHFSVGFFFLVVLTLTNAALACDNHACSRLCRYIGNDSGTYDVKAKKCLCGRLEDFGVIEIRPDLKTTEGVPEPEERAPKLRYNFRESDD
jgi:hypothetical protein